jgi:DNA-binding NarL/FixJ family response regulator
MPLTHVNDRRPEGVKKCGVCDAPLPTLEVRCRSRVPEARQYRSRLLRACDVRTTRPSVADVANCELARKARHVEYAERFAENGIDVSALHYLTDQDLMISAIEDIKSVVRCIELGATDYLTKPFNPVLLTARIDNCIEQGHYRAQETAYHQNIEKGRQAPTSFFRLCCPWTIWPIISSQRKRGLDLA